jgi:hypothetical protein
MEDKTPVGQETSMPCLVSGTGRLWSFQDVAIETLGLLVDK